MKNVRLYYFISILLILILGILSRKISGIPLFIGDILYREKFLKLAPKVKLHIIKRKTVSKAVETNKQGQTEKLIYI